MCPPRQRSGWLRPRCPIVPTLAVLVLALHLSLQPVDGVEAAAAAAGATAAGATAAGATAAAAHTADASKLSGLSVASPLLPPDTMKGRMQRMKVLHEDARIFLYQGLLTPEECGAIIPLAKPRLQPSVIVNAAKSDAVNGTLQVTSNFRTSHGMFFERGENAAVRAVEERIAAWTQLPVYNGEGLQVLRYQQKQHYGTHWDYFQHKDGLSNGGNRYCTVLTYLSDVEEGGETVFPFIPAPGGDNGAGFSECARKHLAVKPRKGDAVLFHSVRPNGEFERRSQHGACPVIKGEKWSSAKWVHVGRWATGAEARQRIEQTVHPIPSEKAQCADHNAWWDEWAMAGECSANPVWMVGDADKPGSCLLACRRCDVWLAHTAKHGQPPGGQLQQQHQQQAAVATQK